jgi:hypothetical protein
MKATLLAFVFLALASRAGLGDVPNYELFLIKPDQITNTTVTTHGDWDILKVTVSKPTAKALLAFSERNLGKMALIALLPPNKFLDSASIELSPTIISVPIRDGIVHLRQPSRKARTRGLLAD